MTLSEISQQRLVNQQLADQKLKSPVEMLSWFGAMQAQEYALTKLSLGLRIPTLKDADLEKDFNSGKILRTHVLRPTWHFVTAEDIRWLLTLTSPRVHAANAFMYRQTELDPKLFNRCLKIIVKTLEGGKQLTREAINTEFKKNKINAAGHRLSYIMMYAELEGVICSGARVGNQFTYALLDERVAQTKSKTKEEALAELTKKYFQSRGPALLHDFSTWSGLMIADCRKGIKMISGDLEQETFHEQTYYFMPGLKKKKIIDSMLLLPVYDEYIMGYKNRDAILEVYKDTKPKPDFRLDSTIIYHGQIIGTWRRVIKSKNILMDCQFFKKFSKKQETEFKKAVLKFERFIGREVILNRL